VGPSFHISRNDSEAVQPITVHVIARIEPSSSSSPPPRVPDSLWTLASSSECRAFFQDYCLANKLDATRTVFYHISRETFDKMSSSSSSSSSYNVTGTKIIPSFRPSSLGLQDNDVIVACVEEERVI
jgi:hypothetical protein